MFVAHVHHIRFIPMGVLALIIAIPIYGFATTHSILEVCAPQPINGSYGCTSGGCGAGDHENTFQQGEAPPLTEQDVCSKFHSL
jgi:hypothetical protein